MKIFNSEKNVEFLGENTIILYLECSNFVDKIREIVRVKKIKMIHEKITCLFFGPTWGYRRNKCP
jgi:hypothetical protein